VTNIEVAQLLRKVAAAYSIIGDLPAGRQKNRFKIIAYENAATSVEHATSELKDLWDDGKLDTVPGLGKSLISHLNELFKTGKVKHFEEIFKKVNPAVFPLLNVSGIGPKKAAALVRGLKIGGNGPACRQGRGDKGDVGVIDRLKKAARGHKIAQLEGFGEKSEAEILENLERYQKIGSKVKRMGLVEADRIAEEIIGHIRGIRGIGGIRADKLGSLRRRVATIGDVDLAVATDNPSEVIEAFVAYPKAIKVIEQGPTGASILVSGNHQVDLRVSKPEKYGAMLQYFTGSKYHNIKLREYAIKKGFSLSEYGIKKINNPNPNSNDQKPISNIQFSNEENFYKFLGLEWIPPELREDAGEIEAALRQAQGKPSGLPKLVELEDIKGDLHLHSDFDLETSHDSGAGTIREIREIGEIRGYEYVGISNHNPSVAKHNPKQAEEKIYAQKKAIEHINSSIPIKAGQAFGCRVLNLLEVDILPNGHLPLSQKALDDLDGCLVSIHSNLGMNREKMTKRVLVGLSNPVARILGHPTGRILNQREGYELDWDEVFAFCLRNNKALEINCFPNRLDLPDVLVREAVKRGVLLSLGTDAHKKEEMSLMEFGASVARRGWAEKKDIINCWEYKRILKWLKDG
jgi:DNA polymerase (family 10)